jgi:hypothetical protein
LDGGYESLDILTEWREPPLQLGRCVSTSELELININVQGLALTCVKALDLFDLTCVKALDLFD